MRPSVCAALLTVGHAVAFSSARAWLTGSTAPPLITSGVAAQRDVPLELGLLPFSSTPLLPGESAVVHFTDTASLSVLNFAEQHHSCCAQLLVRKGGELVGVTGLLEVRERCADGEGVRATLACVGRVRLTGIRQTGADGGGDLAGAGDISLDHAVAEVEPYHDDDEDLSTEQDEVASALTAALAGDDAEAEAASSRAEELMDAQEAAMRAVAASAAANGVSPAEVTAAARKLLMELHTCLHIPPYTHTHTCLQVVAAARELLMNMEGELRKAHANVVDMRSRLFEDELEEGSSALNDELRALGGERVTSLDALVATRRAVLLGEAGGVGGQALPSSEPLCEILGPVWGVATEASATRQALSFAAAAAVDPAVRMHALLTSSTSERLSASLCALREQERRLAAMLALRAIPAQSEDGDGDRP